MIPTLPKNAFINETDKFGPVLTLAASEGRAEIALFGASVLSYASASDSRPVLWLSNNTSVANKPIRGGVPLCAPWFGPHQTVKTAPGHGLIRIAPWELLRVEELEGGSLRATLSLDVPRNADKGWNHDAAALFVITVGKTLSMELAIRNTGADSFLLSEAMHTYFSVSDARKVSVEGLDNAEYMEFAGDGKRHKHGVGPVVLTGEAANMFYAERPVRLVDPQWKRAIDIRGFGTANTVVWNPWEKTGTATKDIGEQWPEFFCVENATISDVAIPLPPNTSHHMGTVISVSKL
jgi:glucose-6-phosphate 1-epimerase